MKLLALQLAAILFISISGPAGHCLAAGNDNPATYQWTDDSGTVNFSDNSQNVPGKYDKQVKKRESIKGEPSRLRIVRKPSPAPKAAEQEDKTYGGHGEAWWREQFAGTRAEIEKIKSEQDEKERNLKILHHRKAISNSSQTDGIWGNPRKAREKYRSAQEEIQEDQRRIAQLEKKLEDLETEAARYGVPLAWRR